MVFWRDEELERRRRDEHQAMGNASEESARLLAIKGFKLTLEHFCLVPEYNVERYASFSHFFVLPLLEPKPPPRFLNFSALLVRLVLVAQGVMISLRLYLLPPLPAQRVNSQIGASLSSSISPSAG